MIYVAIFLGLALAILGVLQELWLPKKLKRPIGAVLAGLLVVSALVQVWLVREERAADRYAAESGVLRSRPTPDADAPSLVLCESVLVNRLPPGVPMFTRGGDDPLSLRLADGEAKLSWVIRDAKGIVRIAIAENEWFVPKNPDVILDRNFTDDTLEVLAADGSVLLQVRVDGARVHLAAKTHTLGGRSVSFGPLLSECPGSGGPLFRYPSADHPGVLRLENGSLTRQ